MHCQTFLSTFTILGAEKKGEVRSQQLKQQREDWQKHAEDEEKKVVTLSSKVLYTVDFEFSDLDKEVALEKLTAAAIKVTKPLRWISIFFLNHGSIFYYFSEVCLFLFFYKSIKPGSFIYIFSRLISTMPRTRQPWVWRVSSANPCLALSSKSSCDAPST